MLTHLRSIKAQQAKCSLSSYDKLAYWAAFTLAFYGFLRASEFTSPSHTSYNPHWHLRTADVKLDSTPITISLKRSKTNQFGKPEMVKISSNDTSTCLVRAMDKLLAVREQQPSGPLFTMSTGRFLTRMDVSQRTKSLLQSAGYDPQLFSSNCYRIGAATTAAVSELPDHLIQTLGRWHSNAYKDYIRPPYRLLRDAATRMCNFQ